MEFPNLGKHCDEYSCKRLDFLPMKCDSCDKIFCSNHFNYENHKCPSAHKNDVQVPICPLCGEPVPTAPGVEPDLTVGQHIDKQCKSDSKKIFTNRCNYKNCKRKELIPVTCSQCNINFCLRHRHFTDHECKGPINKASSSSSFASIFKKTNKSETRTMAAKAAEKRINTQSGNNLTNRRANSQRERPSNSQIQTIQGNMSEDEALARALALSIMEADGGTPEQGNRQNETNPTSPRTPVTVGGRDTNQTNNRDKCLLS